MRILPSRSFHAQSGGITILVALMMLVLLTVGAIGMSRNAFREVVVAGTVRQGAMTRNVADSGIEWSIFWLHQDNTNAPTATATALKNLQIQLLQDPTLAGRPHDPTTGGIYTPSAPPAVPADLRLPDVTSSTGQVSTLGYTLGLTRMGKLPVTDMSQTADASGFRPASGGEIKQAPDLWAVRSDALVKVGTGSLAPTFIHGKEAWISTPVRQ